MNRRFNIGDVVICVEPTNGFLIRYPKGTQFIVRKSINDMICLEGQWGYHFAYRFKKYKPVVDSFEQDGEE